MGEKNKMELKTVGIDDLVPADYNPRKDLVWQKSEAD